MEYIKRMKKKISWKSFGTKLSIWNLYNSIFQFKFTPHHLCCRSDFYIHFTRHQNHHPLIRFYTLYNMVEKSSRFLGDFHMLDMWTIHINLIWMNVRINIYLLIILKISIERTHRVSICVYVRLKMFYYKITSLFVRI